MPTLVHEIGPSDHADLDLAPFPWLDRGRRDGCWWDANNKAAPGIEDIAAIAELRPGIGRRAGDIAARIDNEPVGTHRMRFKRLDQLGSRGDQSAMVARQWSRGRRGNEWPTSSHIRIRILARRE
jgi:hypothetical protein